MCFEEFSQVLNLAESGLLTIFNLWKQILWKHAAAD